MRGALALEAADQLPELAAGLGVEPGRRLVEEEQLGVADDAERDVDAAALAARQLLDARARLLLEPDGRDHLVDLARVRVEPGEVRELLAHGRVALLAARSAARCRGAPSSRGRRAAGRRRARAPRRRCGRGSPRGSRSSCSCRRRSARAGRRSRRGWISKSMPRRASSPPR